MAGFVGIVQTRDILPRSVGGDGDLAVGIGEIDADIARPAFGQLDELSLQDHRIDGDIDLGNLRPDARDMVRRALDPYGIEPAIDGKTRIDRLAERRIVLGGLVLGGVVRGAVGVAGRAEARLHRRERVVRLDGYAVRQKADDLRDVGIFQPDQGVAILARRRVGGYGQAAGGRIRAGKTGRRPRRRRAARTGQDKIEAPPARRRRRDVQGRRAVEDQHQVRALDADLRRARQADLQARQRQSRRVGRGIARIEQVDLDVRPVIAVDGVGRHGIRAETERDVGFGRGRLGDRGIGQGIGDLILSHGRHGQQQNQGQNQPGSESGEARGHRTILSQHAWWHPTSKNGETSLPGEDSGRLARDTN